MLKETWIYKGLSWRARRLKRRLLKPFRKLKSSLGRYYFFRIKYPGLYKKYAKMPVDNNKVIFVEGRMSYITDSFELMYERVKSEGRYDIRTHFLRMGFAKGREYIALCEELIKDMATARYVFLNDASNVIACLPVREETRVVQLWHGCGAFKKFGMSTADLIFGDNRKVLSKYPYHGNYTYVTVSANEVAWAYEEAMSLQDKKGVVVATGVSRSDVFYDENRKKAAYEKLYKEFPEARDKKVILYAPTFRGRVAGARSPEALDVCLLQESFADDYVLVFKHHPFVKSRPEIPEECISFAKDMTDDMTIEELLFVSDICISDYSSLVFEYSIFERPMIFFAPDLDEYYDWRGFYYDYKTLVPGPIYTQTEEIIDYIRNIDTCFDASAVAGFRKKYMEACDGHATDRIYRLVFEEGYVEEGK